MSLFWIVTAVVLVTGAACGTVVFRRMSGRPLELRLLCALAPLAFLATLQILVGFALGVHGKDWSSARLAQSTALLRGYDLYAPADSGPLLSTLYGPVSVLLYLPAAMAPGVTSSMLLGVATNMLLMLVPLAVLLLRATPREQRGLALTAFSFAALTLPVFEATKQMVGSIHVDGPAVGLGLLSCAVLLARPERADAAPPGRARLGLAALLAVLAAWTKQVEAPMVAGQLAWLGLRHGFRTARAYFVVLAIVAAGVTVTILLVFGVEEVFLNTLRIPGAHGFYPFGPILGEWVRMSWPFLLLLAAAAWSGRPRDLAALRNAWGLPALAFLALVPTSILARAKHGGFLGSFHCQYYLVAAAALAFVGLVGSEQATRARRLVVLAGCLVLGYLSVHQPHRSQIAAAPYPRVVRCYETLPRLFENRQEEVVAFAREHPHQAYFPWNPLATLYADGELYHFEWAVFDRTAAQVAPSEEHIRAHLPRDLRYVVYPRNIVEVRRPPKMVLMPYLPEFSRAIDLEGYPDWVAFVRPEDVPAAASE